MLTGQLTLSLAGRTYDLAPGDAAHFDSRLPHRLIARGRADAELILVASPLSQSAPPPRSSVRESRAIPIMEMLELTRSPDSEDRHESSRTQTTVTHKKRRSPQHK